jgi:hypothetical protein
MYSRVLLLAVLALALSLAMPLAAADAPTKPAEKSYKALYWETKRDGTVLMGVLFNKNNDGLPATNWVLVGRGVWFGGWRDDHILLGNVSLDLVYIDRGLGNNGPATSLGFTVAPVGFCLGVGELFHYQRIQKGQAMGLYLKPTYTYLVGLNGRVAHQSAFGTQLSLAWK